MDTRRKLIILADAYRINRESSNVRSARRADLDRLRMPVVKVLSLVALPDHVPKDGDSLRLRRQARRRADASAAASVGAGERQPDLFA